MSKPVEVEKVGADSPLDGTGIRCEGAYHELKRPSMRDVVDARCVHYAPAHDQFLTFSFPSHADSERNGPESNHQVHVNPVIITFITSPTSFTYMTEIK